MVEEYSVQDKYQVYTFDLSNGINKEIDTMLPATNFLTVFFVNTLTGESINNGKINISFTAKRNYPLTFLNGSKYKAQFQKFYLTADVQPNISVRIFISQDAYYEKELPVTSAVLQEPIKIEQDNLLYDIACIGDTLQANTLTTVTIGTTLNSHTVKGIKSILLSNLDTTNTLYFGKEFTISNYSDIATSILAGEKLSIDFNPQAIAPFEFTLFSTNNVKYQASVLFNY